MIPIENGSEIALIKEQLNSKQKQWNRNPWNILDLQEEFFIFKKASKVFIFTIMIAVLIPSYAVMGMEREQDVMCLDGGCSQVGVYGGMMITNLPVPRAGWIGLGFSVFQDAYCSYLTLYKPVDPNLKPDPSPPKPPRPF